MTTELRTAVVGVGALGRHHARILSEMDNVELVAVADPNQEQGEAVAEACGCEWRHDYRTLLGEIDAVSIVVPTTLHRCIAEEFICRSIPTLIEKPLTADVEDGAVLVRQAKEHDVPLQVGHIERFNPAFQRVQEWTSNPKYIRAERVSPYAFRSMDIGVVHDLMIHDIELVLSLTEEAPIRVEAFGACLVGGHEDVVQARLYFPSGCIADITANRVAPAAKRTIQCWSDQGCVDANLHTREVTRFAPGQPLQMGQRPYELAANRERSIEELKPQVFGHFIETETEELQQVDALTAELTSFLDCIRQGTRPLVSGADGLAALKVAAEVLSQVQIHQWDGSSEGRIGPNALIEQYKDNSKAAA